MSELIPFQPTPPSVGLTGNAHIEFDRLRPDDLASLMKQARIRGIQLEHDPQVQATMRRFWDEFRVAEERYSPRTLRQLTCMWEQFSEWCTQNNEPTLPTEIDTVKRYLSLRAQDKHRNTLAMDRWCISRINRAHGCPDPTIDKSVVDIMAALVRVKVEAEEAIKQASAFRECHIDELVELWSGSAVLADRRDLAMLVVAYETLLRSKELANIKMAHIKMESDGSGTLMVPITKTNKSGEPDFVYLSSQCLRVIREYLSAAGRTFDVKSEDPLFTRLNNQGKTVKAPKPLAYTSILKIFVRAWTVLDLENMGIPRFSAHSARVGAAQDLASNGFNSLEIMLSGRWASEVMVARYCRSIYAKEGAMAKLRKGKR